MGYLIENGVLTKYYEEDGITEVQVPEGVTSIGEYAFLDSSRLQRIILPCSVTGIGKGAFCGCTCLRQLLIPDHVTAFEKWLFTGCGSLTELTYCGYTIDMTLCMRGDLNTSLFFEMMRTKNYGLIMDVLTKYYYAAQVYLKYREPEAEGYIRKRHQLMFMDFIDIGDYETVRNLLETDRFVSEKDLSVLIDYAIGFADRGGDRQIQISLMDYKYKKYPGSARLDELPF